MAHLFPLTPALCLVSCAIKSPTATAPIFLLHLPGETIYPPNACPCPPGGQVAGLSLRDNWGMERYEARGTLARTSSKLFLVFPRVTCLTSALQRRKGLKSRGQVEMGGNLVCGMLSLSSPHTPLAALQHRSWADVPQLKEERNTPVHHPTLPINTRVHRLPPVAVMNGI